MDVLFLLLMIVVLLGVVRRARESARGRGPARDLCRVSVDSLWHRPPHSRPRPPSDPAEDPDPAARR